MKYGPAAAFFMTILVPVGVTSVSYAQILGNRTEATSCAAAISGNVTTRSAVSVICGIPPEVLDALVKSRTQTLEELRLVPALIAAAGDAAGWRYVEFFTANIRNLFDWLIIGQVAPSNPASAVRGPTHMVKTGTTPVLEGKEWRRLIDAIPTDTVRHLRERAGSLTPFMGERLDRKLIEANWDDVQRVIDALMPSPAPSQ
jgi:hypothetical protein